MPGCVKGKYCFSAEQTKTDNEGNVANGSAHSDIFQSRSSCWAASVGKPKGINIPDKKLNLYQSHTSSALSFLLIAEWIVHRTLGKS